MSWIFISYRRSDSEAITGRIYDRLVDKFSYEEIFKDVDSIPEGVSFPEYLKKALEKACVMVVVIGSTWLTVADENGLNRLKDPRDYVRMEIKTALRLNIPIIPVTVSNAIMPKRSDLPKELRELCNRNGQPIRSDPDFHQDMDRLVSQLRTFLKTPSRKRYNNKTIDSSVLELISILKQRSKKVEQWLKNMHIRGSSNFELIIAIEKFQDLFKQHIKALQQRQFVLAHEILGNIHELLQKYDATMYDEPIEYDDLYPGKIPIPPLKNRESKPHYIK